MRVVETFGHRMSAFKLPPQTAEKLKEFMNYAQNVGMMQDDGVFE
jgi:hypothetical protein